MSGQDAAAPAHRLPRVARPRLAVAGHVCVDVKVTPTTGFPERGRLVECERIDAVVGGAVGNVGRVLATLGEPALALCRVGPDAWGDLILDRLAGWADTRYVTRSSTAPTSGTVVFVAPDGERSFIHARGANVEFAADQVPLDELAEAGVEHLHLGYALLLPALDGPPMARLLAGAVERGMTTSLDMTWDATGTWMTAIGPLLAHVDVFCPNDAEAAALTGQPDPERAAVALLAAGVRQLAVVTCGGAGAVGADRRGVFAVPAVDVGDVDATGAGDCFNGALITALLRGATGRDAVEFAVTAAAVEIAVSRPDPP